MNLLNDEVMIALFFIDNSKLSVHIERATYIILYFLFLVRPRPILLFILFLVLHERNRRIAFYPPMDTSFFLRQLRRDIFFLIDKNYADKTLFFY
jgi:hypothetical protein